MPIKLPSSPGSLLPFYKDGFERLAVTGAIRLAQRALVFGDELGRVAGVEAADPRQIAEARELDLVNWLHQVLSGRRAEVQLVDRGDDVIQAGETVRFQVIQIADDVAGRVLPLSV